MRKSASTLVVDLDGTLINTDLLVETASQFLVKRPLNFFRLLLRLLDGKPALKLYLAISTHIDVTSLPYNKKLIAWLGEEKAQGRRIVLATGTHLFLAEQVAGHLGLFDEVLATDGGFNLKGSVKRDLLVSRYGNFDYIGNDWPDLPVWKSAEQAHVVSSSTRLIDAVFKTCNVGKIFNDEKPTLAQALSKAVRPHQWLKNTLIIIPLLASHRFGEEGDLYFVLMAFFVFGITASSVYLLNDIVDVSDDRHHFRKKNRPFAAGHLSLLVGWLIWPSLLLIAFTLSILLLPYPFTFSLGAYFIVTVAYSMWLKKVPVVDVIVLAGLYTLRIIAGAAAISVPLTFWLLSFSMFLFLSLAFMKRHSELHASRETGKTTPLRGRGYASHDTELVANLGVSAGYTSILVLALYIQDAHTANLYATPQIIGLACPILLYWISRAWLIAGRGQMHDDPIVFALKDKVSWAVVALLAVLFVLAKVTL